MATKEQQKREAATVSARDMLDDAPSRGRHGTYFKCPEGVTRFTPTPDTKRVMRLIFLPWKPGKNHPRREQRSWVTNYFFKTHNYLGPNSTDFACSQMWGRPCAVCDHFQGLRETMPRSKESWKVMKEFKPKDSELLLLHDLDGPPQNVQVWDESVFIFGDFLRERIQMKAEYANYCDFTQGLTVLVKGREKQLEQNTFIEYASIDFDARPFGQKMPAWMTKACETFRPDEWVFETAYDKMKKLLLRTGGPQTLAGAVNGEAVPSEEVVDDEAPPDDNNGEPFNEFDEPPPAEEEVMEEEPAAKEDPTFKPGDGVTFTFKGQTQVGIVKLTEGGSVQIVSGGKTYKVKLENAKKPPEPEPASEPAEEVLEEEIVEEEEPPAKSGKK